MRPVGTINALFIACTFLGAGSAWLTYASDSAPLLSPRPAAIRSPRSNATNAFRPNPAAPCVIVGSQGIYLGDLLAVFTNINVAHVRLEDAPVFGQFKVFTPAKTMEAWKKTSPETAPADASIIPEIRVARRSRALEESELKEMVIAALQKVVTSDQGELTLRFSRPWTPIQVPEEPIELRVMDMPLGGLRSSFFLRFELRSGAETIGSWQLALQAQLVRTVWVARTPLKRGDGLSEAVLAQEKRDVLNSRDALADWSPTAGDFECADYVAAGSPLYARSVRAHAVIRRGDVVEALLQDGAMTISLKVEALEEGAPGQVVRVRNLQTKRELRGKVQNEQTVMVNL
jgi:flagella basal body P-ring formation protein FlgA